MAFRPAPRPAGVLGNSSMVGMTCLFCVGLCHSSCILAVVDATPVNDSVTWWRTPACSGMPAVLCCVPMGFGGGREQSMWQILPTSATHLASHSGSLEQYD